MSADDLYPMIAMAGKASCFMFARYSRTETLLLNIVGRNQSVRWFDVNARFAAGPVGAGSHHGR